MFRYSDIRIFGYSDIQTLRYSDGMLQRDAPVANAPVRSCRHDGLVVQEAHGVDTAGVRPWQHLLLGRLLQVPDDDRLVARARDDPRGACVPRQAGNPRGVVHPQPLDHGRPGFHVPHADLAVRVSHRKLRVVRGEGQRRDLPSVPRQRRDLLGLVVAERVDVDDLLGGANGQLSAVLRERHAHEVAGAFGEAHDDCRLREVARAVDHGLVRHANRHQVGGGVAGGGRHGLPVQRHLSEALPRARVEHAQDVVEARAHQPGSRQDDGEDATGVRRVVHGVRGHGGEQLRGLLLRRPGHDAAVAASGEDHPRGRIRHQRVHGRLMPLQHAWRGGVIAQVEHVDVAVEADREEAVAPPRHAQLHVRRAVPELELLQAGHGLQVPGRDGLVGAAGGELGPVGADAQGVDGALVRVLDLLQHLALAALVHDDLAVVAHAEGLAPIRREAHALGKVGVGGDGMVPLERRALVEQRGEVLAAGEQAVGPAGPRRAAQHGLGVAQHLADAVAAIPHEGLAEGASAALADRDDALALGVPGHVVDAAAQHAALVLDGVLLVVVGPDLHIAALVRAGRGAKRIFSLGIAGQAPAHPVAVGAEARHGHALAVAPVHQRRARVGQVADHHAFAAAIDHFVVVGVEPQLRVEAAEGERRGRQARQQLRPRREGRGHARQLRCGVGARRHRRLGEQRRFSG
eukprot:scaffold327_cov257-Pinguiococcus_pyrenoidosus.AAC.13